MALIHSDDLGTTRITKAKVDIHIENSLSGIQLQRVGKIPINSIHGLVIRVHL